MWIVTGGAGLIGSALIWQLNQEGVSDILVVDHLGRGEKWRNLAPLSYADYVEKDLFRAQLEAGELDRLPIEGVLHMGACSSTTEGDASYLADNNFRFSCLLAEYCMRRGIRFLYASSCATYGDGSSGYRDDEAGIDRLRPLNMYGYSKQMFDLWARHRGYLNTIIGCKFSNVWGPNERHKGEMRSVVLRAFEQITETGKMKLFRSYRPEYADGEQKRDFLYVKDAARMVLFLFRHPQARGIYNIGSGVAETWNTLARAVFDALGKPVNIEYVDMPESLRLRYQYYTCTEMQKFYALGCHEKPLPLAEAVRDDVVHYLLPGRYLGDEPR